MIEALGDGPRGRISRRPAGHRRRDYAVRPVLLLPECQRTRSATDRWAAGSSATRSTARGRSTCSYRMPAPTSRRARRAHRRAGPDAAGHRLDRHLAAPRAAVSRSATPSRSSRRARLGSAPRSAHGCGRGLIIGVDSVPARLDGPHASGADRRLDSEDRGCRRRDQAPHRRARRRRGDRGTRAARRPSRWPCASIRPGGTLSSLGVYSGKLVAPYEAFYAGLGDQRIVTTLCPGGKERMRRLMAMVGVRTADGIQPPKDDFRGGGRGPQRARA